MVSFPLVHRWGRDVDYIVGVLGSLTTRYDLVISCHGGGPGQTVLYHGTPKTFWSPAVCCETNRRAPHKPMLDRASNVYGTGPETYDRVEFSTSLQYCSATVTR